MKIVFSNEKRISFDNKIDMSIIGDNVILYDYTKEEIIEQCNDMDIITTKEIKMPSYIINISRGKVIDEKALLKLLDEKN